MKIKILVFGKTPTSPRRWRKGRKIFIMAFKFRGQSPGSRYTARPHENVRESDPRDPLGKS